MFIRLSVDLAKFTLANFNVLTMVAHVALPSFSMKEKKRHKKPFKLLTNKASRVKP